VIGVDLDIHHAALASRLEELARTALGDTPAVRFGMQPKRLLVFRTTEPLSGIKAHPIEVLGLGQQFVAFADHPETKRPYEWPQESPADLPTESLPPVDEGMMRAFLEQAQALVPPELRPGRLPGEPMARTAASPAVISAARPRRSLTRYDSSPMPISTTTAGSGSAWRSRARSARTAGTCSPPGPRPRAKTCLRRPPRPWGSL
jgi:hypothetical protein